MGREVRIGGVPNPRQAEFFACRARYVAYGGARGGGKSWALRRKLVAMCIRYPGLRALLVRRSLGEVEGNHLDAFLQEYGALLRWQAGERCLVFANGSRIRLGYFGCEADAARYQGQEFDVIALDEATQMPEAAFVAFKACLRGTQSIPRRLYLTCNPGGIGHAWVKRLFVDRVYRPGEVAEEFAFIPARVEDNRVLLEADPGYLQALQSLPERLRAAWLEGRWDVFEGQFFPEFSEEVHRFREGECPELVRCFAAVDYGFDQLAALLLGVDADGGLWVLREHCEAGRTLSEAARAVARLCAAAPLPVRYVVASPDLWNRRQDTGRSGFSVFQETAGMPPMRAADDRRIPGWRILREYLADGGEGVRLRIHEGCRVLLRSLPALLCDPIRAEDASDHPHEVTHGPEALRYAVMSCPAPTRETGRGGGFRFPEKRSEERLW